MKKSTESKRGGIRPGSGRKPLVNGEESVTFSGKVPFSQADAVDRERGEMSRGDVLRESLALWLKRRGK